MVVFEMFDMELDLNLSLIKYKKTCKNIDLIFIKYFAEIEKKIIN